jgi:MYXO-CTERM domain-containing protein
VLASAHPVIARYATGGAAGVSDGQITHFGFPLECAGAEADRVAWFSALLPHLLPDWEAPEIADDGGGDDGGDGTADGSADGGGGSGGGADAGAGGGEDDVADGGEAPGKGVGFGGCAHTPAPRGAAPVTALLGLLALPALRRGRRRA